MTCANKAGLSHFGRTLGEVHLRHLTFALAACAALATTPTLAQQATQNAPLNRNASDTIICQEYPAATGSHIGKRVICLTNRQWEEVHREAREGYNEEVKKSYSIGHGI